MKRTEGGLKAVVTSWLRQRLAELGTKQSSIMETLTKENIKGIPENPSCCPIARYVEAHQTTLSELDIKPTYFRVDVEPVDPEVDVIHGFDNWLMRVHLDDHKVTIWLPANLAKFAYDFDHNEYPELIDQAYIDRHEERMRELDELDELRGGTDDE